MEEGRKEIKGGTEESQKVSERIVFCILHL